MLVKVIIIDIFLSVTWQFERGRSSWWTWNWSDIRPSLTDLLLFDSVFLAEDEIFLSCQFLKSPAPSSSDTTWARFNAFLTFTADFLRRDAITGSRKQVFMPEVKGHRKWPPFSCRKPLLGAARENNQTTVDVNAPEFSVWIKARARARNRPRNNPTTKPQATSSWSHGGSAAHFQTP